VHNSTDKNAYLAIDLQEKHPGVIFQSAYIEPNP
jgi:hypothetical protein